MSVSRGKKLVALAFENSEKNKSGNIADVYNLRPTKKVRYDNNKLLNDLSSPESCLASSADSSVSFCPASFSSESYDSNISSIIEIKETLVSSKIQDQYTFENPIDFQNTVIKSDKEISNPKNDPKTHENVKITVLQNLQVQPAMETGNRYCETEYSSKNISEDIYNNWNANYHSNEAEVVTTTPEIGIITEKNEYNGTGLLLDNNTLNDICTWYPEIETTPVINTEETAVLIENNVSSVKREKNLLLSTEQKKVDRTLIRFGKIVEDPTNKVEYLQTTRPWTKKAVCLYCTQEVTHFPRHLQRNHQNEGAVKEILSRPFGDPKRKDLLNALRRQGNFLLNCQSNLIRPIRRKKVLDRANENEDQSERYLACKDCFGFFSRNYLSRHRRTCSLRPSKKNLGRENHLSESQIFTICSGAASEFYNSLRLKDEVFKIMRADEISKIAMNDFLICSYAESLLQKHKRTQIRTTISNKMRELGRLLKVLKEMTGVERLFDILSPEYFDNIVAATKIISGYNPETRSFEASSLALHMGTTLKQVCDIANKLIIKKSIFFQCTDPEQSLKSIKRLKHLISNHWNSEISSLALKDLNEKNWERPKLYPLTSDVIKFETFVMTEARQACENIGKGNDLKKEYKKLTECVLALTLLLNRKRIGEVQYLKLTTYNTELTSYQQDEILQSLSESEKLMTKNFKRVVTGGKGSKPVAVLFPKKIQSLIEVMIENREKCVPYSNEYLFANPITDNRWLSGYHVLKKLAQLAGIKNEHLFTSTRLRKQIATVLQVINVSDAEMEQFATFMGHTRKTHEAYYRLPQDLYQTAKVSKLLIAVNKGKAAQYKGKSLDEIEFSDNPESDDSVIDPDCPSKPKSSESEPEFEQDISGTAENSSVIRKRGTSTNSSKKRIKWSQEQKTKMDKHFKDYITRKKPPRKNEVEKFIAKYSELFNEIDWSKIKSYVYNSFTFPSKK